MTPIMNLGRKSVVFLITHTIGRSHSTIHNVADLSNQKLTPRQRQLSRTRQQRQPCMIVSQNAFAIVAPDPPPEPIITPPPSTHFLPSNLALSPSALLRSLSHVLRRTTSASPRDPRDLRHIYSCATPCIMHVGDLSFCTIRHPTVRRSVRR
jgi:hypothetical protein